MTGKAYLRSALGGFVLGLTLYAGSDVVNDVLTFHILRSQAVALAEDDEELLDQIGSPLSHGPWYNSTIGFTHRGNIAQCTFQLIGSKQITDINVKGIRGPGYASNLLYNTIGPRTWDLMMCSAMMPAGGGKVKPKTLIKTPYQASKQGVAAGNESVATAEQEPSVAGASVTEEGTDVAPAGDVAAKAVEAAEDTQQQRQRALEVKQPKAAAAAAAAAAESTAASKPARTWWAWVTGR